MLSAHVSHVFPETCRQGSFKSEQFSCSLNHLVKDAIWRAAREQMLTKVAFRVDNVGALIFRTWFGGILYYNYNKEPRKPYSNYSGPYTGFRMKL